MEQPVEAVYTSRKLKSVFWLLWGLLLLTLPVTSSPVVSFFTGNSTVSPLATIPLLILLAGWIIPYLLKGGRLPSLVIPLAFFIGAALFASVLSPLYGIFPLQGQSVVGRVLRASVTLILGIAFYLAALLIPYSKADTRRSLKWLYAGAVLMLLWSSVQAFFAARQIPFPDIMMNIHRIFVIRDIPVGRVAGLAYEPSWLGDQLVILYLPLWISSVIRGYSAFSDKLTRFSVELGLTIWGAVILFFSHSRIGLFSAAFSLGVVGLGWGWRYAGQWSRGIRQRFTRTEKRNQSSRHVLMRSGIWIILALLIVSIGIGLFYLSSQSDRRLSRLFNTDYLQILQGSPTPLYKIAQKLAYGSRVMYWTMGYQVFNRYPIFGVGLGNSGFFIHETIPAFGYAIPEVIQRMNGEFGFPNPKNLWIRLLAETGIVGFLFFVTWILFIVRWTWKMLLHRRTYASMVVLAGTISLIALIFEGFSLDTFALPHLWVMLGFLSAVGAGRVGSENGITAP
jgi:O-antigen ligase